MTKYDCPLCDESYTYRQGLSTHMTREHQTKLSDFNEQLDAIKKLRKLDREEASKTTRQTRFD